MTDVRGYLDGITMDEPGSLMAVQRAGTLLRDTCILLPSVARAVE